MKFSEWRALIPLTALLFAAALVMNPAPACASPVPGLAERDFFRLLPPPPKVEVTPVLRPEEPVAPSPADFLVLRGIVVADPSLVLLEDRRTGRADLYRPGAWVGGARIASVETDRVLMTDETGGEFSLSIASAGVKPPPLSARPPGGEDDPPVVSATGREDPSTSRPAAEEAVSAATEVSLSGINREMLSVGDEMGNLQVAPVIREGRVAGYQVRGFGSGRLAEMAARFGFQEGDILTRLNGAPVTGFADIAAAYRRVSPGEPVSVTVLRGGSEVNLDFTISP